MISLDLKHISSFTLFLGGLALFGSYLFNLQCSNDVDAAILWAGALLMSSMLVLILLQKHEKTFLFGLFLCSFFILIWEQMRFGRIIGTDIMMELNVAEHTAYGGWTSGIMIRRSGTCLSVTILPAAVSAITGMSVSNIFETLFFGVSALLPVFLYLLIKQLTNSVTVAGLSSVIFTLDYEKLSLGPNAIRENIAKIFLITTLCILYKRQNVKSIGTTDSKLTVILFLTVIGVVTSHYSLSLFLLVLFALLKLSSLKGLRKIFFGLLGGDQKRHPKLMFNTLIFFAFVTTLSWLMFTVYPMFLKIVDIGQETVLQVFGMKTPDFHPYTQFAITFPRGGAFTLEILWIYRFLMLIGALVCLRKYRDFNTRTFIFMGIFMFFTLGVWFVAPHVSRELQVDRVYSFGLPFFSFFAASSISEATSLFKQSPTSSIMLTRLKIIAGHGLRYILPCFLISLFFLNHIALLPAFYYSPTRASPYQELLVAPFHTTNDIELCKWVNYYCEGNAPFLGDLRSREVFKWLLYSPGVLAHYKVDYSVLSSESFSSPSTGVYISLFDYAIKDECIIEIDIRAAEIPNATMVRTPSKRVIVWYPKLTTALFSPGVNLLYNNEHNYLFHTNFTWDPTK